MTADEVRALRRIVQDAMYKRYMEEKKQEEIETEKRAERRKEENKNDKRRV